MITKTILLQNGYKQYKLTDLHPYSLNGYSKCIYGDLGKKYYINFQEYSFDDIPNYPTKGILLYSVYVQFTLPNDEHINIDYLYNSSTTLQEIEEFYEKCFGNLNCEYYEKLY